MAWSSLIAAVRFQMVRPTKAIRATNTPATVPMTIQSLKSICRPRNGTMIIINSAGNRSSDLSTATEGSELLTGMLCVRLRMSTRASSPLPVTSRKLINVLTRTRRTAVPVFTWSSGFRKSFQRAPRMTKARMKKTPERSVKVMPVGVIICSWTRYRLDARLTKREIGNNKATPIKRPMITLSAGWFNARFI